MEFLAIKSENGKGVYLCKNKQEKSAILKQYEGCSNRTFSEKEKDKALEWANVKEVANRPQQVVNTPSNTSNKQAKDVSESEFIDTLNELKNMGYSAARIFLNDGTNFTIIIDAAPYYANLNSTDRDGHSLGDLSHSTVSYGFDTLRKYYEKYYCEKDYPSYEDFVYEYLKNLRTAPNYNSEKITVPIYNTLPAAKIIVYGKFIVIDKYYDKAQFKNIEKISRWRSRTVINILDESNVKKDLVINTESITKIVPLNNEWVITDKNWLKAISRLESEGLKCKYDPDINYND